MEERPDKQALITRLVLCGAGAFLLYYGGEKLFCAGKLPIWGQYRPWLEENKLQAIAIGTAVLFGLSLLLFPIEEELPPGDFCDSEEAHHQECHHETQGQEGYCPCE